MYQTPRGTQDILPADRPYWRYVTEQMHQVAALFGFQQIDPPIFEETALFVRGVGQGTARASRRTRSLFMASPPPAGRAGF